MIRAAILAALALTAAPVFAEEALDSDLIELVQGTWKVVADDGTVAQDCDKGQHFEPSADGRHIVLTEVGTDFSANYVVMHTDNNRVLTYIENEERLTDQGDPVIWWLYFLDQDHFRWRRYDWPKDHATGAQWIRCDANTEADQAEARRDEGEDVPGW